MKFSTKMQSVQMNDLRGMLDVRTIDKMRKDYIRKMCDVKKKVNEKINASILRWFEHMERMDKCRHVKWLYRGERVEN